MLRLIEAEGLNIGNTLQMGNSGTTYFRQYNWKTIANEKRTAFVLVPGQEDPRTSRLGHTLHLNIAKPVRDPLQYFLYSEMFEETRAQGATTGYAHVSSDLPTGGARAGLALDVPLGLVDFVEVLQFGRINANIWFDFLNLGFKLSPAAGTDYPYADVPGAVRNYVRLDGALSPAAWFEGLRKGRPFVTNGPMLRFTINNQSMGSEMHVDEGIR